MDDDGFKLVLKGRKNKLYKEDANKPLNNKLLPNKNDNLKNKQIRDNHIAKQQQLLKSNSKLSSSTSGNINKKKETYALKTDEELYQQLLSNINKSIETIKDTQFFKDIVENEKLIPLFKNLAEIICYGIGSCQSSKKCQEQFALIIALKNYFSFDNGDTTVYIFDPVMSESDKRLVEHFQIKLITINEEAKRQINTDLIDRYTLFYMPFCPRKLYDNVLWANFSISSLRQTIILGNSFDRYNEMHLPPDQEYLPYCYTKKLYKQYKETPLPTNYPTKFIFHDLSFHYFEQAHLKTLEPTFWIDKQEPPKIIDDPEDFLIGGTAGSISMTMGTPLERLKLLLIVPGKNYKSLTDCFVRVAKEEGLLTFWKGNLNRCIGYFPSSSFNFAFNEFYKNYFVRYKAKQDPQKFFIGNLMSGGFAGFTSLLITYPVDYSRIRLAQDKGSGFTRQFTGLGNCISSIYKRDGLSGLYRGFGISIGGITVYRSIFFGGYATAKEFLLKDPKKANLFQKWLTAQAVVTAAGILYYPFGTVRRRMMMQQGRTNMLYSSSFDCWRKVAQREGLYGFFKGSFSNSIRSLGGAFVLVFYEQIQQVTAKYTFNSSYDLP
ncbi:hypothetical protein PPL_00839 [Heterostelium album PN500]|uniref:SRR1-like domain-containing protein n=1 Tax=Heterostelium pallidum (strain ATCC 26659 / Pp 5 / PN500) TaxID=670386 RepID=D3AXK8_HETP5|nr:hypothetical protein PPL_00839 [Heterostelium album PN500]EFA86277.1 hypothetical protein PPL_00839 [Heterostelium album PN500]|eukprot:XP_020438382.1 hypothetical protein PPL_00839 [Heterostelium album PN500]